MNELVPHYEEEKMNRKFQRGVLNGGACGGESEHVGGNRQWHNHESEVIHL